MSRLFRRPSSKSVYSRRNEEDPNSAFSSLLKPATTVQSTAACQEQPEQPPRRRSKSSPGIFTTTQDQLHLKPWLGLVVAERHTGWKGERLPTRKLVKDPGSAGSARPSFSHELSDHADESDGGKDDGNERGGGMGIMRRGVERIRELYRRDKG